MTPQPGTDLMPVDASTAPPGIEAFYSRAARQHVTWLSTISCEQTTRTHVLHFSTVSSNSVAPADPAATTVSYSSTSNWSGYVIGGGSQTAATTNHYAQSGWYVPVVTAPTAYPPDNTGWYYSAVWVGLGGGITNAGGSNFSSAHPLIQAGTEQDVKSNGSTQYYFWWEVYPMSPNYVGVSQKINQLSVKPGDEVGAVIDWVPGSNSAGLGVCDWNTNTCVSLDYASGEPSNTTEWIVEAPGTPTLPLANFGTVNFFNGCWAPTTTFSINHGTPTNPNVYPLSSGNPKVTGSITGTCHPINEGPSLTPLGITTEYAGTAIGLAIPGALGSNGSDFQVTYKQP